MVVLRHQAEASRVRALEFLCDTPLVGRLGQPQLQSNSSTRVVGLPSLTARVMSEIGSTVVYLEHDRYLNEVDRTRYAEGFAALPTPTRLLRDGDGWRVWQLGTGER